MAQIETYCDFGGGGVVVDAAAAAAAVAAAATTVLKTESKLARLPDCTQGISEMPSPPTLLASATCFSDRG